MFKLPLLKLPLLALTSLTLLALAAPSTLACDPIDAESLSYGQRDDGRCEGIQSRVDISGSLDLISFTSSNGGPLGRQLSIRVPSSQLSPQPQAVLKYQSNRYLLDRIPFQSGGSFLRYQLNTRILTRANINQIDSLRALATSGNQRVYQPVLLGQPASSYDFVFYSVDSVRFLSAEIRQGSNTLVRWGPQAARRGEKNFVWNNAINAAAGRYQFRYVAEIEQRNRPPERIERVLVFDHNPDWLR